MDSMEQGVPAAPRAGRRGFRDWPAEAWWAMLLFFFQPVLLGCLLVRIPEIKEATGVNKAELALGILGAPVGSLVFLPIAGAVAGRVGMRNVLLIGLPVFAVATVAVGAARDLTSLAAGMALLGSSMAFTEIGLNVNASNVERRNKILFMGSAHGCWALGQAAGGLAGVLMVTLGVGVMWGAAACAAAVLPAAMLTALTVRREKRPEAGEQKGKWRPRMPSPALAAIGMFLLSVALVEGAALEWSALYMTEQLGGDSATAGWAFSALTAAFAAMRFACDWIRARTGEVALARMSAAVSILALALIVAKPSVPLAVAGFGLLGAGVAAGFPLAMSAAGHLPGKTASNVAFLSFMAIGAFLTGPVVIGFVSELTDLRWGLSVLFVVLAVNLAFAGSLGASGKKSAGGGLGKPS